MAETENGQEDAVDEKAAKKAEQAAAKAAQQAEQAVAKATGTKTPGTIPAVGRGIAATAGFFGRRIKHLLGGVWDGTVGQVTGEAKEIAAKLGYENKEAGPLNSVAGIIEGTTCKIGSLLGTVAGEPIIYAGKGVKGLLSYTGGLIGRVPGRILRGVQRSIYGVIMGKEAPQAA